MSKVYSFRLDENNPRETQAREVIDAWMGEEYSLRYVIVDALLSYERVDDNQDELSIFLEKLQDLILSLNINPTTQTINAPMLSSPFLDAVKQSVRSGVSANKKSP